MYVTFRKEKFFALVLDFVDMPMEYGTIDENC